MGQWDYQAIEILENETPLDVMRALYETQRAVDGLTIEHHFRAYHTFCHNNKHYLHIGWNSCNRLAYHVLTSLQSKRAIISTYSGVGFAHDEDTFKAHELFSADASEDFNPPITFNDVMNTFP